MLRKVRRKLRHLPCKFGFHKWRNSRSMPEKVCRKCGRRAGKFGG